MLSRNIGILSSLIVTLWFHNFSSCTAYYTRRSGGVANNALQTMDNANRYYQSDEAILLDMIGKDAFEDALDSYLSSGNIAHDRHTVPKTAKRLFAKRSFNQFMSDNRRKNRRTRADFLKRYFEDTDASKLKTLKELQRLKND